MSWLSIAPREGGRGTRNSDPQKEKAKRRRKEKMIAVFTTAARRNPKCTGRRGESPRAQAGEAGAHALRGRAAGAAGPQPSP
mmetsp:Transcript_11797/g.33385  ORF Transcript_11797/g.33385 Transcript_11797/m.33385 type:complete len:82 (+) Transcript_11797:1199-1444(+)